LVNVEAAGFKFGDAQDLRHDCAVDGQHFLLQHDALGGGAAGDLGAGAEVVGPVGGVNLVVGGILDPAGQQRRSAHNDAAVGDGLEGDGQRRVPRGRHHGDRFAVGAGLNVHLGADAGPVVGFGDARTFRDGLIGIGLRSGSGGVAAVGDVHIDECGFEALVDVGLCPRDARQREHNEDQQK